MSEKEILGDVSFAGTIKAEENFCTVAPDLDSKSTRTRKMNIYNEKEEEISYNVPIISPNTIRAMLRDNIARDIIERVRALDYKTLLFLASGGNMDNKSESEVSSKKIYEVVKEFTNNNIVASIFGGSLFGVPRIIPGKLICMVAYLKCIETGLGDLSARDLTGEKLYFVRKDDSKDFEFFSVLSPEGVEEKFARESQSLQDRKEEQERKKKERDKAKNKNKKTAEADMFASNGDDDADSDTDTVGNSKKKKLPSSQMVYSIDDYVIKGAEFKHEMILPGATATEVGAILSALKRFARMPFLGCYKSKGFGLVSMNYNIYIDGEHNGNVAVTVDRSNGHTVTSFNIVDNEDNLIESCIEAYADYLKNLKEEDIKVPVFK